MSSLYITELQAQYSLYRYGFLRTFTAKVPSRTPGFPLVSSAWETSSRTEQPRKPTPIAHIWGGGQQVMRVTTIKTFSEKPYTRSEDRHADWDPADSGNFVGGYFPDPDVIVINPPVSRSEG